MRRLLLSLTICFFSTHVSAAPEFIDGSDGTISPDTIAKLSVALMQEGARDPLSAQYHSMQPGSVGEDYVCGYVNLKNGYGAYTGFKAFQMRISDSSITILNTAPGDISWNLARIPFTFSGCVDLLGLPGRT